MAEEIDIRPDVPFIQRQRFDGLSESSFDFSRSARTHTTPTQARKHRDTHANMSAEVYDT